MYASFLPCQPYHRLLFGGTKVTKVEKEMLKRVFSLPSPVLLQPSHHSTLHFHFRYHMDPHNPLLPLPKTLLAPNETLKVPSDTTSTTVYNCKRVSDHYSCTCPAWRIQRNSSVDSRTCKHLRGILGNSYEDARLAWKLGVGGRGISTSASISAGSKKRLAEPIITTTTTKKPKKEKEKKQIDVLLAKKFELEGKKEVEGWWISEKLDGIRAYWDGEGTLWSRLGNPFAAPEWFTNKLPKNKTLDGELFHSRNNFSLTSSIVRSGGGERWNEIRYKVFDIPSLSALPFESRLEALSSLFPTTPPPPPPKAKDPASTRSDYKWVSGSIVELVQHTKCRGKEHLMEVLKEVERGGGEGLMLREPESLYVGKRSGTLLKVKTFFNAEAKVVGYEPGKGKYKGQTGSLLCEMESGQTFSCGSGLNDDQRLDPPNIGAIISYRFQEVTKDNVPRFPTFVGERIDVLGAKDADVTSKGGGGEEEEDE